MIAFLVFRPPQSPPEHPIETNYYSTCPAGDAALVRNVVYKLVPATTLLKWAKIKPRPKVSRTPDVVQVLVQIEGESFFCGSALSGSPEKRKEAVDTALQWKFKEPRGDFNDDVMGVIRFRF
jgi:hypothetical protein